MSNLETPKNLGSAINALKSWASQDPSLWNTGLSPKGALLAQRIASELILTGSVPIFEPPPHTVIWCAANVFTAPLEWVVQLTANGGKVTLKAPSKAPESAEAIANAFSSLGVAVHISPISESWGLLSGADAVIGFGGTASMASLSAHIGPHIANSLHGHRVSFAVVDTDVTDPKIVADALALDLILYDGRGCMSPVAIFTLGSQVERFADELSEALQAAERQVPRGGLAPREGAEWRRKTGLARILGRCIEGDHWAVTILPIDYFEPHTQPRLACLYKVESPEAILRAINGLPLSTCGTNLSGQSLRAAGFSRICPLGKMQTPPLNRLHDGTDVLKEISGES